VTNDDASTLLVFDLFELPLDTKRLAAAVHMQSNQCAADFSCFWKALACSSTLLGSIQE